MKSFCHFKEKTRNQSTALIVTFLLLLAFIAELYFFSRQQEIWIDETTQLSGVQISFGDMLRWLGGTDPQRFGVPADRMPPISYALDWIWLRMNGPSEVGFRLFHSAIAFAGVFALVFISMMEVGVAAAVIALAFVAFSPKLIQVAVEIRAYPIFFFITCLEVAVFLHLVQKQPDRSTRPPQMGHLLILGGLCIAAIYCHFYGVVSTCAFFLALALAFAGSLARTNASGGDVWRNCRLFCWRNSVRHQCC